MACALCHAHKTQLAQPAAGTGEAGATTATANTTTTTATANTAATTETIALQIDEVDQRARIVERRLELLEEAGRPARRPPPRW